MPRIILRRVLEEPAPPRMAVQGRSRYGMQFKELTGVAYFWQNGVAHQRDDSGWPHTNARRIPDGELVHFWADEVVTVEGPMPMANGTTRTRILFSNLEVGQYFNLSVDRYAPRYLKTGESHIEHTEESIDAFGVRRFQIHRSVVSEPERYVWLAD